MFPFLAPIKSADHSEHQGSVHIVEITFLADSPHVSRAGSAASVVNRQRNDSGSTKSNEGLNVTSRPSSRQKTKSPLVSSQPTSARSVKSSPIPPVPSELPPAPSRHKNKGLETSAAMKELFGGGPSYAASSAFDRVPPPSKEQGRFDQDKAGAAFSKVESHEKAYERAMRRARGENQFSQEPKPGPEWFEGFERLDLTGIDLPPDPNCPAAKLLAEQYEHHCEKTSDQETIDNVDQKAEASTEKPMFESIPGPDLGNDEEEAVCIETDDTSENLARRASGGSERNGREEGAETETADEGRDAEETGGPDAADSTEEDRAGSSGGGMSLLIRGAQVVNDDSIFVADVLVQDGVIASVGPKLDAPADGTIIDASGKMLLPAGIDVYTQFSAVDSLDDLPTGCRAALAGGTATVIEVVKPKSGESLHSAFNRVRQSLENALCNVALSIVVREWSDSVRKDMEKLVAEGVNSFIVDIEGDDKLYQILEHCRSLGAYVRILPENRTIVPYLEKKMLELGITGPEGFVQSRPEQLESERVSNVCVLSQLANCPISILSISSAEALGSVEKARNNGALANAEVAAAAVAADGSRYFDKDLKVASAHLTEIPLRSEGASRLVSAFASQPLAVCTSGHKAVDSSSRVNAKDFTSMAKGATGAEERLLVLWEKAVRTGRIDPMRFVAVTSSNAAKIFNMYPKKGRIAVGADADLLLWDASAKRVLRAADSQSAADVSLFEGLAVHAAVLATIVGGRVSWKEGGLKDAKGGFVALSPNSPFLFSVVSQRDKFGSAEKVEREPTAVANGHHKKSGEFDRDRNRKNLMESSIDFGGSSGSRSRNPPGGRTTGFW